MGDGWTDTVEDKQELGADEVLDLDESEFENPNADVIKKEITESETLDPKEDEVNSEK